MYLELYKLCRYVFILSKILVESYVILLELLKMVRFDIWEAISANCLFYLPFKNVITDHHESNLHTLRAKINKNILGTSLYDGSFEAIILYFNPNPE